MTLKVHASDAEQDARYTCTQGVHHVTYSCCTTSDNGKSWSDADSGCGPNNYLAWDICDRLFGNPSTGNCTGTTAQRTTW